MGVDMRVDMGVPMVMPLRLTVRSMGQVGMGWGLRGNHRADVIL